MTWFSPDTQPFVKLPLASRSASVESGLIRLLATRISQHLVQMPQAIVGVAGYVLQLVSEFDQLTRGVVRERRAAAGGEGPGSRGADAGPRGAPATGAVRAASQRA